MKQSLAGRQMTRASSQYSFLNVYCYPSQLLFGWRLSYPCSIHQSWEASRYSPLASAYLDSVDPRAADKSQPQFSGWKMLQISSTPFFGWSLFKSFFLSAMLVKKLNNKLRKKERTVKHYPTRSRFGTGFACSCG